MSAAVLGIPAFLALTAVGFLVGAIISGDAPTPLPFAVPLLLNLALGFSLGKVGRPTLGKVIGIGGSAASLVLLLLILFAPC